MRTSTPDERSGPAPEYPEERRSGIDRRLKSRPRFFSAVRRRHSAGRRRTDGPGYVDVYDTRSWALVISVLALSLADAVLTGIQVACGRTSEANPVMAAFINRDISLFFAAKAVMTAVPLAVLLIHKEWKIARQAARLCLWAYITVSVYHMYLISGCPGLSRVFNLVARVGGPA